MKKDKTMSLRDDDVIGYELDYLCDALGLTRSEVVRYCVDNVYTLVYLYNHFGLTGNEVARCLLGK